MFSTFARFLDTAFFFLDWSNPFVLMIVAVVFLYGFFALLRRMM